MSNTALQYLGLQHARLPYPLLSARFCSNSYSLSRWLPSNHLSLSHSLLLPSVFPSISVFSNESTLRIRWPKYWSITFSLSPSNKYPGLISCRIDRFNLLPVQGNFKSFLQHHNSKVSILWCSAFFMVQLLHVDMTTGRTIALTIQTFVDNVMSAF